MAQYDVIIVGAGPAGMTAAIYAARAGQSVLLLDKLAPGGQIINTNEIQNYPGVGTINGAELAYQMFEHTRQFDNITFDYGTVREIQGIGSEKKVLCVEKDKEFTGKALILATGTRPRRLEVPGEDRFCGNGISWCAICDGPRYRDQDVVVIGGGNSAVEESIFLAGFVKSLTIITMLDLTADPIACEELHSMDHVTIYPYQEILGFAGDTKLTGVHFKSAETGEEHTVSCDGVFEYIGLTPSTEYLRDLNILNSDGYLEVDEKMHTRVKGIFGAGDCVTKNLRQVITACADGAVAAQEAAHFVRSRKDL
ncbi:NAD(P)/FAD-dependent oxidoreductase [Clostridium sp. Marseille-P2415]|uniref:NAD(P)/FAD-dependent oxidoreductase n=1 Tax=Clostridium sp. Marseille-P2415 TaxID=1805471 RepID=UPI0009885114|nr:FAD-dependent oxidoreductase [Clostridium sp. Marseille-P2415]